MNMRKAKPISSFSKPTMPKWISKAKFIAIGVYYLHIIGI